MNTTIENQKPRTAGIADRLIACAGTCERDLQRRVLIVAVITEQHVRRPGSITDSSSSPEQPPRRKALAAFEIVAGDLARTGGPTRCKRASSTRTSSSATALIGPRHGDPPQRVDDLVAPVQRRSERLHAGKLLAGHRAALRMAGIARPDKPSRHWPSPSSSSRRSWCWSTVLRWLTLTTTQSGSSVRSSRYSANSWPSSSAEVASSRNTAFGLASRIRANAMRCCSPGESTLAQSATSSRRLARCASATLSSTADQRVVVESRPRRRVGHHRPQIAQRHIRHLRQEHRVVSAAGQCNVPDVNGHSCARLRSSVVLPAAGAAGDHQRVARVPAAHPAGRSAAGRPACGPRRRRVRRGRRCCRCRRQFGSALAVFVGGDQPVETDDGRPVAGERVVDGCGRTTASRAPDGTRSTTG